MQDINSNCATINLPPRFSSILVLALFILFLVAAYAVNASRSPQANALPPGTVTISQDTLKEKYGLHLNLVAVTAAGGLVDVRLKIIDGEKAKSLLKDSSSFPSLFINKNVILSVPQEVKEQEIQFEKNGNLFILFPNAGNAIKTGTQVRIMFGNLALEPVAVQ